MKSEIEQLGKDIAALTMRIHAATYELPVMLREFDGQKGWGSALATRTFSRAAHVDAGSVLDAGRKTRTVPTPIRRAPTTRDRCCRFPGCTARRCWDGTPFDLGNVIDAVRVPVHAS